MIDEDLQPEEVPPTAAQLVIGGGVVLTLFIGLVLAAWPTARALLWTQEAAAWVQAIGSVAAIAAAVWIAYEQAERERLRRKSEDDERRVRNISIALAAVQYIQFVAKGINKDLAKVGDTRDISARSGMLAQRIAALRAFAERLDVTQLDNARIVPRYFGVLEAVVSLDAAYLESSAKAGATALEVLEICCRFTKDFGEAGAHTVKEFRYLPEFRD